MNKPTIQIGDQVREMTDAEYAQWQLDSETAELAKASALAQVKVRQSALAKLAALGLTEAEISALIGG
jgi:hypothetical protein